MIATLLLLAACGGAPDPEAAPHVHGSAADHGHGAKHGGIQNELDGMHVEGLAQPGAVMFWVTDGDAKPLPLDGITGKATVKSPNGTEEVVLASMGDHLHGAANLQGGQSATITVELTRDGRTQSSTFQVASVGLKEHDHSSLHGGQVGMWGDHHVEYVGAEGEYKFWVTNATRVPVTSGLSGIVKDGETRIPLVADDPAGLLSAKGDGAGTRPVTVDVTVEGKTFTLGFNPSGAGGHEH